MKFYHRRTILVFLLICLFLAPGMTAIWIYQHPTWLSGNLTNKGQLLRPPLAVKALSGQWGLILWYPNTCDKACLINLEKAHRILLALGRRYYEIKLWCLQDEQNLRENHVFEKISVVQTLGIAPKNASLFRVLGDKPLYLIANPQGYLILSYPVSVASQDIYQDLKRLFRVNDQ